MKKLIAVIAVFAAVLSLSACKTFNMTPEEKQEYYAAEESKKVAASIQAENDYIEGVNKHSEETIGKTIKDKKIVIKNFFTLGYEYRVYEFNKKGDISHHYLYKFYDEVENYNVELEIGPSSSKKIVDKDPKARMIVYEIKETAPQTFDEIYEAYSNPRIIEHGYSIIE
ncbi:MAG: hypothetical protein IJZ07_08260 [Clostridia bacterium]|nr:hypothetical protein [Clostridia bacterium]